MERSACEKGEEEARESVGREKGHKRSEEEEEKEVKSTVEECLKGKWEGTVMRKKR